MLRLLADENFNGDIVRELEETSSGGLFVRRAECRYARMIAQ